MELDRNYTKVDLTEDEEKRLMTVDSEYTKGKYVHVMPLGICLSRTNDIERLRTFQFRPNDVFVMTPPKSGTTWMQEIVWLIRHDLNLESAKVGQFYRMPFLEFGLISKPKDPYPEGLEKTKENLGRYIQHSFEYGERMESPRTLKTHMAMSMFSKSLLETAKVVFVARNIKDMVVSYYHHYCLMKPGLREKGFPAFADLFRRGLVTHAPVITMILEAWKMRDHPNLCFVTYEELKRDFASEASKVVRFLKGRDFDDKEMELLKRETSFDVMKENNFVNKKEEFKHHAPDEKKVDFIRKGQVGDWRNHFTEEMNAEWDPWIEAHLKGTDYKMVFDL